MRQMPTSCGDMKFRQRIAWLSIALYLACTVVFVYYIFEISDAFNNYALDHIKEFHKAKENPLSQRSLPSISHVLDIPKPIVIFIIMVIYLQIFFMLIACTKQEPRMSVAYAWPWFIYNKVASRTNTIGQSDNEKSIEKVISLPA